MVQDSESADVCEIDCKALRTVPVCGKMDNLMIFRIIVIMNLIRYLLVFVIIWASPARPLCQSLPGDLDTLVVGLDGSGDFTSIQAAIHSCRSFQTFEKVIYIKNGVYREKILIDTYLAHIQLIGENRDSTIITFDDHAWEFRNSTFLTYTLKVLGDHVTLENLTIRNTAGQVGQAVALHMEGDYGTVRNCRLLGNQDTLYAAGKSSRQYYADCYIEGTTDYIFGAATAVFDRCTIHSKRDSYITAASTPEGQAFGYVFRDCRLTASPGVASVYLGRPWRDHARVIFINCEMGGHIRTEGWHNWGKPAREETVFYAEYKSTGPGAHPGKRVSWSHQLTDKEAKVYRQDSLLFSQCSTWEPLDKAQ